MKYVYVVYFDYYYDNRFNVGVFSSLEKARDALIKKYQIIIDDLTGNGEDDLIDLYQGNIESLKKKDTNNIFSFEEYFVEKVELDP